MKRTDIADRIAELRPQHEDRVLAEVEKVVEADLRRRADRVAVQCGIHSKIMEVIRARSEDPLHQSVPGGHTGLIAVHWKKQGKESKLEAEVDGVLLRELRATQEYIARELGEWRDQASVEHTIKSPADIPLNVLDMLEQQTRAELAAVIEAREYTYQPPAPAPHPALAEDGEHVSTPAAATDGSTSNPTHDSSKSSTDTDDVTVPGRS